MKTRQTSPRNVATRSANPVTSVRQRSESSQRQHSRVGSRARLLDPSASGGSADPFQNAAGLPGGGPPARRIPVVPSRRRPPDSHSDESDSDESTAPAARGRGGAPGRRRGPGRPPGQRSSTFSRKRRLSEAVSSDSEEIYSPSAPVSLDDTEAEVPVGRTARRRALPARYRDAPPTLLMRRRTSSSGAAAADASETVPAGRSPAPHSPRDRLAMETEVSNGRGRRRPVIGGDVDLAQFGTAVLEQPDDSTSLEYEQSISIEEFKTEQIKSEQDLGLDLLQEVIGMDHGFRPEPAAASPPADPLLEAGIALADDEVDLIALELEEPPPAVMLRQPERTTQAEPVARRKCRVCHRSVKAGNMRQHMLSHASQRPFRCEFCPAAFPRRSDVFRHVKILHHQQKPFKCTKDGKEFTDRRLFMAHMEMHNRPALFACKVCDTRFGKFSTYVSHVKYIHPTGEPLPRVPEQVERAPEPLAPPRGRFGPTPLQSYLDPDEDDPQPAPRATVAAISHAPTAALECIETEEIPRDVMQEQAAEAEAVLPMVVEGHDVVIGAELDVVGGEADAQIFPSLEDDAAAILGMTDLALTNENTSLQAAELTGAPPAVELATPAETAQQVLTLASGGGAAAVPPRVSQPRVVTIGRAVPPQRLLLTRPLLPTSAAAPLTQLGRQVVLSRTPGHTTFTPPAVRALPVIGSRTASVSASVRPPSRTMSPAVRAASAGAPPALAPATSSAGVDVAPGSAAGAEVVLGGATAVEVAPGAAGRTIVLQARGGAAGAQLLHSERAMRTLLDAVQQLVSAQGDTLEGKQIEIVMQDDAPGDQQ